MKARVTKILSKNYWVNIDGNNYLATPRGAIKQFCKILVGDIVEVDYNDYAGVYVINKVYPRINELKRPPVANLEQLVIVIALVPAPDFELVDKLLIFAMQQNIKPIFVVNKCDLATSDKVMEIINAYKFCTEHIIAVSALTRDNLQSLVKLLRGKLSAFAGQSAVGKSTLINALTNKELAPTQELSAKLNRGKHTTRHTEIYSIDDILIADTAGFSMLELKDIKYDNLHTYYPEFASSDKCAYSGCTHVNCSSKDCAIVEDVESGVINTGRYERYVKLYNALKGNWRNRYD